MKMKISMMTMLIVAIARGDAIILMKSKTTGIGINGIGTRLVQTTEIATAKSGAMTTQRITILSLPIFGRPGTGQIRIGARARVVGCQTGAAMTLRVIGGDNDLVATVFSQRDSCCSSGVSNLHRRKDADLCALLLSVWIPFV